MEHGWLIESSYAWATEVLCHGGCSCCSGADSRLPRGVCFLQRAYYSL